PPVVEKPRRSRSARSAPAAADGAAPSAAPNAAPKDDNQQLELVASNGNGNGAQAVVSEELVKPHADVAPDGSAELASPTPEADGAGAGAGQSEGGETAQALQRTEPGRQRHDLDPGLGNSRRRRRRSREKAPRGGEREFGAQAPEVPYTGELVACSGLLDLREEGYGFLRANGYLASSSDVYVSITQVRRYGLRKGDLIEGAFRPAANNEKYPALVRVDSVAGMAADEARNRPKFENLTPLFPDEKLSLEVPGDPANVTARIVDLVSPIGKGQRGLIVSPPKAGKTTILKQIAHSIEANNPEVHLMILLVDERPEEVTDWRRSVKGEVIASTFDRPSDEHTQVAELAIERAKRLLEAGRDVVIVLDGITRLARAYNLAQPATGRIMSGGIDTGALYPPKKFFGSARNIEEGGSLTILATALVETGSRMDEVIFEEFKGTGNMELRLDRKLAERRIYPALDVNASSTRHEELLFDRQQLQQVWKLRRVLNALATDGNAAAGLELLVDKIRSTRSNDQFLAEIAKTPAPAI
ncbi:MAG TPA: transcription termination factor Rho, partial [Acidimicrobiales bacterium]|nr:transcription termination factor Rho [Acidimicrobiales bacterium]